MPHKLLLLCFLLTGTTAFSQLPEQPFTISENAFVNGSATNMLSGVDTGVVQICQGSSVLLVIQPDFPNSLENTGTGYSQTSENVHYTWIVNGSIIPVNNDSIMLSPSAASGSFISVQVTDLNYVSEVTQMIVQTSSLPVFNGITQSDDTINVGEEAVFTGGISDVSDSFDPVSFFIGGFFASTELVPLPDGSGVEYTSLLNISQTSDTITDVSMIPDISISMEHSYAGDLEIVVICPTGDTLSIANLYSNGGGMLPGGCSPGGLSFGNDMDIDAGPAGNPAWSYNFSFGSGTATLCESLSPGQTINNSYGQTAFDTAIVYIPDGDPNALIGCPLQGEWKLKIRDNMGVDDGYIFGWAMLFEADVDTFTNFPVSSSWAGSNIEEFNEDGIVVSGVTPGTIAYTFSLTDNFGCVYDTTLNIVVIGTSTAGLTELTEGDIFPNPVRAEINYNGTAKAEAITLTDFSGRTLGAYTSFPVDISDLPTGMYYLTIETKEGKLSRKILKE